MPFTGNKFVGFEIYASLLKSFVFLAFRIDYTLLVGILSDFEDHISELSTF